MSNRKRTRKQPTNKTHCTIPTFLIRYPDVSDHRLRWALRHRETNGLGRYVVKTSWAGNTLLLEHVPVHAFLTRTVPA